MLLRGEWAGRYGSSMSALVAKHPAIFVDFRVASCAKTSDGAASGTLAA
jgi:hypothetical protein